MTGTIFERTLATAAIEAIFSDAKLFGAMLEFEAALAEAEADEGVIPGERGGGDRLGLPGPRIRQRGLGN